MTASFGNWPKRRLRHFIAANRDRALLRLLAHAARVYLDRYGNLNYDPRLNGERFVLERLARHRPQRIFDVGANVGDWALLASALAPGARIDCFEVLPPTAELLARRNASHANVAVHALGLADTEGRVDLTVFPADHGHTTMTAYGAHDGGRPASGLVTTGDRFVTENGIDRIDLLKIDVEGAEDRVLRGFERTFAAGKIDVVQFEYGLPNIVTKYLLRDFCLFFAERGFLVGKIYPTYVDFRDYRLTDEDFRGPNYLAVRRERVDLVAELSRP